jgi:hypothetical protein
VRHNKAPGLDGFLAKFHQKFWKTIKTDLLELFDFFACRAARIVLS